MSDFKRKFSMENYKRKNALDMAKRNATKTHKASLKDFDMPIGSWTAHVRTDCSGAIKMARSRQQRRSSL